MSGDIKLGITKFYCCIYRDEKKKSCKKYGYEMGDDGIVMAKRCGKCEAFDYKDDMGEELAIRDWDINNTIKKAIGSKC